MNVFCSCGLVSFLIGGFLCLCGRVRFLLLRKNAFYPHDSCIKHVPYNKLVMTRYQHNLTSPVDAGVSNASN